MDRNAHQIAKPFDIVNAEQYEDHEIAAERQRWVDFLASYPNSLAAKRYIARLDRALGAR